MRITLFLIFAFAVQVSVGLAQISAPKKSSSPAKTSKSAAPKKTVLSVATKISDAEWKAIISAIEAEDWMLGARLSTAAMSKLKTDNSEKQLARLRYFYVFALAGQAAAGRISYPELEKTVATFVGKEFLMPSRQLMSDCRGRVNYICPAGETGQAVRVTATNLQGSEIHSFEYVQLTEKAALTENQGRAAFLGGNLQAAEINEYRSGIKALRLVFDRGRLDFIKAP